MELQQAERYVREDSFDKCRLGFNEQTDGSHEGRQPCQDVLHQCSLDIARARFVEHEPQRVDARMARIASIFVPRDSTDLDARSHDDDCLPGT
jgi:hypothetical protein